MNRNFSRFLFGIISLFSSLILYAQAPSITSFTPSSGSPGTLVTISGSNLGSATSISIGSTSAIIVSNTSTQIVGMVMPGVISGPVGVTTSGGTATASGIFTPVATGYPSLQQGSKLVGTGNIGAAGQGNSVALSADGNTAIVSGGNDNNNLGAVWIYVRNGNVWTQQGNKLIPTDNLGSSTFGMSVALSADGNTALVGGYSDNSNQGAAWIFVRSGSTWIQQGNKLVGSGNIGASYQGFSVALSADGNTAIVGAIADNNYQGAAWIFTRNNNTWTQQGNKLVGSGNVGSARQGISVALSADGNTAIVGGSSDNIDQGAAWIFTRTGNTWIQQGTKLVGTGNIGPAKQGYNVTINANGSTCIIGGPDDNSAQGAAWIFTRNVNTWTQQGNKLVGTGNVGPARQGYSVSLSADGNTAIVGGFGDNTEQGAAWIFTRSGNTWIQQVNKLVGTGNVGPARQGLSVELSADGNTASVGGPADNSNQGATWLFSSLGSTITSFTPITGNVGTTVTITGTNFNTTASNNIVYFGAAKANVTAATATSLTVSVPTGATYQPISVTNTANHLTAWSANPFTLTFNGSTSLAFTAKSDFTTGTTPKFATIVDLDANGRSELIVANNGGTGISVLQNTSNTGVLSFASKTDFATGGTPLSIAASDVDGDGKLDLAVVNEGDNNVSILLNTSTSGTISFASKVDVQVNGLTPPSSAPASISAADIDGDGRPDLVVSFVGGGGTTVAVLLNTSSVGTASFASPVYFGTGSGPFYVTVADIDGDGKTDIITANGYANTLSVLRNTSSVGNLSFATKVDLITGSFPYSVQSGDIDGDGKTDLVAVNSGNNTVSVLRNTSTSGSISFAAKVDFATGTLPQTVAIGDISGDGKVDLVVVNQTSNTASVFRNTSTSGTISFATKVDLNTGTTPYSVTIGDLNADGKTDIAVTNSGAASISVFLNRSGNTSIVPVINSFTPTTGAVGATVTINGTNFNTTAANNLVYFGSVKAVVSAATATSITTKVPVGAAYQTISVTNTASNLTAYSLKSFDVGYVNLRGSGFASRIEKTTNNGPGTIVSGDIDGDGKPDLVVQNTSTNSLSVFRNVSSIDSINLDTKIDYAAGLTTVQVNMADLDGDGKPELLAVNYLSNSVSVFRNTSTPGNISFAAKIDLTTGTGPLVITTGDIDGDGKPDLAVANNAANTISVFLNASSLGTINFVSKLDYTTGSSPNGIFIADIDNDSKPDIAVLDGQNLVSVFRNTSITGNINFAPKQDYATGNTPNSISIADMDGDGKLDIIVPNLNSSSISILRNTSTPGAISLAAKTDLSSDQSPGSVGIGDFNGDGKPDLVVAYNSTLSSISIFTNKSTSGTIAFAARSNYETGSTPYNLTVSDIDGDGRADIALTSYSRNSLSVIKNVALPSPPTLTSNTNANSFCTGGSTVISSSVLTGNQWYKDGVLISGAVNQTVTVNAAGSYTDTITTRDGYKAGSAPIIVLVNALPQVLLSNTSVDCSGTAALKVSAGSNSLAKILWYRNDSLISTVMTDSAGITVAGGNGLGNAANQLNYPVGVFVDAANNVYVSDYFNHRIQKWAPGASTGVTVAGGNGQGSAANQLYQPNGVYVDSTGNMYIADEGNQRIQKWAPGATSGITVANGNGPVVADQFVPDGIVLDNAGNMYIVDVNYNRILKWTPGASSGITVAGGNGKGSAANQLSIPQGVSLDGNGNVYVADLNNRRIQKWAPGASAGVTVAGGNGAGLSANQLNAPYGVFADSVGNVYVSDIVRVQKWISGATLGVTVAGSNIPGNAANRLSGAIASYVDRDNNIYVVDENNQRIQKWARKLDTTYNSQITGVYKAVATDYNGCSSVSNSIAINPAPAIPAITAAGSLSFCSGDSVKLISSVSAGNQWYKDSVAIPGATDSFYVARDGGNYTDSVTALGGCKAGSAKVTVTVNAFPAVPIITANHSLSFCTGDSLILNSSASSGNQWYKDGAVITGETNASLIIKSSGTYIDSVSNGTACKAVSAATVVSVNPVPPQPLITGSGPLNFCSGDSVIFSSSATSGNQWYKDGVLIKGATGVQYTAKQSGVYTDTVSNASGCTIGSVGMTVTVKASPTVPSIAQSHSAIFCAGDSIILTSSATTNNQWYKNNIAIAGANLPGFTATTAGVYVDSVTNTEGCKAGSAPINVIVNALPVVGSITGSTTICVYAKTTLSDSSVGGTWSSNSNNVASVVSATGEVTGQTAGTAIITYTIKDANGCISQTNTTVTVNVFPSVPVITASRSLSFCTGDSLILNSSVSSGNQWYKDGFVITGETNASLIIKSSGTYIDSVSNGTACKAVSAATVVSVNPVPSQPLITGSGPLNFCSGDSVIFSSSATSGNQWYKDGILIKGATGVQYTAKESGVYTDTVSNVSGCTIGSVGMTVTVKASPTVPSIAKSRSAIFCAGDSIILTSSATTNNQWYKNNIAITGANLPGFTATTAGVYVDSVTNTEGCKAGSAPINVIVNPLPVVGPITGSTTVCAYAKITLSDSSIGGTWSSSKTSIASVSSLSGVVTGQSAGIATITYTIKDTNGCVSQANTTITVNAPPISTKPKLLNYNVDTLVCFTDSLTVASKNTYDKYLWSTGETTASIRVKQSTPVYLKVAFNNSNCYSDSSVIVDARKNITSVPIIKRVGDSLFSTLSANYRWYENSKLIPLQVTNIYPISQKGFYNVATSDDNVCFTKSSIYFVQSDPAKVVKDTFSVIIYPNPNSGNFKIQINFSKPISAVINLLLVDQLATVKWNVKKYIFSSNTIKIPATLNLTKGVYTLRVEVNGLVNTQQVIVQ